MKRAFPTFILREHQLPQALQDARTEWAEVRSRLFARIEARPIDSPYRGWLKEEFDRATEEGDRLNKIFEDGVRVKPEVADAAILASSEWDDIVRLVEVFRRYAGEMGN